MTDDTTTIPGPDVEGLQRRLDGGVLWLVLDRPAKANTFTRAMQSTLVATFEGISEHPTVRAVVVTAAGDRHFCAGPDLGDPAFAPRKDRTAGDASRTLRDGSQRVVAAMLDCEQPILCGLNGTAVGGGANLALAADLIVAADGARLIELFTQRGLIPDGGAAYLLARHLPRNVVKELVLFGTELTADEGHRLGLYNLVVPPSELDATLRDWAARLAAGPTRAFAAAKALLNGSHDADRASAFAIEAALVEQVAATDDVAEGVAAFREKRPPKFSGR
jgi:2-(1,2-epoxy-1,2-dihydrophenyl)acetyl-CoA isomerase